MGPRARVAPILRACRAASTRRSSSRSSGPAGRSRAPRSRARHRAVQADGQRVVGLLEATYARESVAQDGLRFAMNRADERIFAFTATVNGEEGALTP
jgi:hypothetical protein